MIKDKTILVTAGIITAILVSFLSIVTLTQAQKIKNLKQEAIDRNYASVDRKTGELKWKPISEDKKEVKQEKPEIKAADIERIEMKEGNSVWIYIKRKQKNVE